MVSRPELDPPGGGWQLVDPDRLKGEDNGSTYRDRAGVAGPDWENSEELEREGSAFDRTIKNFVQASKRFVNTVPILAQIGEAIGETLGKWVIARRLEKEEATLVLKPTKKEDPMSEWEKAIS